MSDSPTTWIAIDGHGGSGKSTLAKELATRLKAEVIHIDDFTGEGSSDDWYKRVLSLVFKPIENGQKHLSYSRAKWWPEHKPKPVINQPVTQIMIIEGVGSLRNELRGFIATKVFVDTPRPICIQRGLARDRGMGGKSDDEITALWEQWIEWDNKYFAKHKPQDIADVLADGTQPYDMIVEKVIAMISNA